MAQLCMWDPPLLTTPHKSRSPCNLSWVPLPALHLSAANGNSKIVEYLLLPMHKAKLDVPDRWNSTPLLSAIVNE